MPPGPDPTTRTRRPVGGGTGSGSQLSARARSPRKRSMALIPTASSIVARLHAVWQGWNQARPMTAGKGLTRRISPPCGLVGAVLGQIQPTLDILAGWAGVIARGEPVHVHRPLGPPAAGLVGQARPHLECDGEGLFHQAGTSSVSSTSP